MELKSTSNLDEKIKISFCRWNDELVRNHNFSLSDRNDVVTLLAIAMAEAVAKR